MIRAAGILFLAEKPTPAVLILKRSKSSDHPGEWALPGGMLAEGEAADQGARREAIEECGDAVPDGEMYFWIKQMRDGVDYETYLQKVDAPFSVTLNHEHEAYQWIPVDALKALWDS